jgi:hypothetical protein
MHPPVVQPAPFIQPLDVHAEDVDKQNEAVPPTDQLSLQPALPAATVRLHKDARRPALNRL